MNKTIRIILIILFFGLLLLVRAFEQDLFYDPLILYFQNDYLYKAFPQIDACNLLFHLFFRYVLNSLISLAIIHMIFRNKKTIKFSLFFFYYCFSFVDCYFFIVYQKQLRSGLSSSLLYSKVYNSSNIFIDSFTCILLSEKTTKK